VAVSVAIFVAMSALGSESPVFNGLAAAVILTAVMVALLRYGLLSLIAVVLVVNLFQVIPQTTSLTAWYFPATAIPVFFILALAVGAFAVSLGNQPWFGADEPAETP
jgi:hypothetical protein